jgi:RNA polymerase sigma-70 factor (ECF subfamily)
MIKSSVAMSPNKIRSDAAGISSGSNQEQFDQIFLENWSRIHRLLWRLMGDSAEAEDLALETFMRLYQKFSSGGKDLNIGGWLYRVATNLGLNAIRSRKRRQQYELTAGQADWEDQHLVSPADMFAVAEERKNARSVLGEMEYRQAQLLLLRYSGKSYKEIALIMEVSPASIGPMLARAEREFEKRYRAAEKEEG